MMALSSSTALRNVDRIARNGCLRSHVSFGWYVELPGTLLARKIISRIARKTNALEVTLQMIGTFEFPTLGTRQLLLPHTPLPAERGVSQRRESSEMRL